MDVGLIKPQSEFDGKEQLRMYLGPESVTSWLRRASCLWTLSDSLCSQDVRGIDCLGALTRLPGLHRHHHRQSVEFAVPEQGVLNGITLAGG